MRKSPKRSPDPQGGGWAFYEEICAKNKARRKKEWLENYKKQQAELAKKRAAKKNKVRKNDEKESEE